MNPEEIETVFFNVLEDINEYLPDLTLVGGWMPYVYSNFLWKTYVRNPVTTVDIDFGVNQTISRNYSKTIFETLSSLKYRERHIKIGKSFPVVLCKDKVPVEFITYPEVEINAIEKMIGQQVQINKIDKFDFLLQHSIAIDCQSRKTKIKFVLNCPKVSAFLYHKGATFIDREDKEKQAKDLYYIYFILRYAPETDSILKEIIEYRKKGYLMDVLYNMNSFFDRVSGQGCLMVEAENGHDEYIQDIRQDIFDRFREFRKALQDTYKA